MFVSQTSDVTRVAIATARTVRTADFSTVAPMFQECGEFVVV